MADADLHAALSKLLEPWGAAVGERIVRVLAWLAWADGELSPREAETLEQLIAAFPFDDAQRNRLRAEIPSPAPLGSIVAEITEPGEKRLILALAQFLAALDARQAHEEVVAIANLAGALGVPGREAQDVLRAADALAKEVTSGVRQVESALADVVGGAKE